MSNFSFTATAQCDRCGNYLSSSDEECDECLGMPLISYHFVDITGNSSEKIVIDAVNSRQAWQKLSDRDHDSPLVWKCEETGDMTIHARQMGIDMLE